MEAALKKNVATNLILDEIQVVSDWDIVVEKYAKENRHVRIITSGSRASYKSLGWSSEYLFFEVKPLNFVELMEKYPYV